LKALADINRGKLTSVQQVQKYMGQAWPLERVGEEAREKELCTRAFLFSFKALTRYVIKPYRPDGAEVAAVALKLRARIAQVDVYVEDTVDLILWYPSERRLELVNFQTHPLKPVDPAWPTASQLIKAYLAERLKVRWPFERLTITTYKVGANECAHRSVVVDDSLYRLHFEDITRALEEMKQTSAKEPPCSDAKAGACKYCSAIKKRNMFEYIAGWGTSALSA
jgi:hypothetical protein